MKTAAARFFALGSSRALGIGYPAPGHARPPVSCRLAPGMDVPAVSRASPSARWPPARTGYAAASLSVPAPRTKPSGSQRFPTGAPRRTIARRDCPSPAAGTGSGLPDRRSPACAARLQTRMFAALRLSLPLGDRPLVPAALPLRSRYQLPEDSLGLYIKRNDKGCGGGRIIPLVPGG